MVKQWTRRAAQSAVIAGMIFAGFGNTHAQASRTTGWLYQGMPSPNYGVICLQKALNYSINANLTVDGNFGPLTYQATRRFQSAFHLHVDGIVGPNTGNSVVAYDDVIFTHACYYYVPTTY